MKPPMAGSLRTISSASDLIRDHTRSIFSAGCRLTLWRIIGYSTRQADYTVFWRSSRARHANVKAALHRCFFSLHRLKEGHDAVLVQPVSYGIHMVAARQNNTFGSWNCRNQGLDGTGGQVFRTCGHQHGNPDLLQFLLADRLARRANAGGKRLQVTAGLFGKAAKRPRGFAAHRI